MKRKHILSLALMLALVLMLTLLPIRAEAATVASGTCGDNLTWVLDDKGTLTISGTGPMDNFWEVGCPWGDYRTSIKKVTIPNSVTSIGDETFYCCTSLTSVTIPDSVTTIGESAFHCCESLKSVTIPNSVTAIGDYAFYSCDSLTSVTIGNSVTIIGDGAFSYCTSLTSVTIPNSVETIGNMAFSGCTSLTSVTIPDSVTAIGSGAFKNCTSLTGVTIGNGVTTIGYSAFDSCDSLTSVTIGNSVTTIGNSAFDSCDSLTSVTIPNSVTAIGDYAFYSCDSLTSVTIGSSVTKIGENAFYGCESLTSVTIPNSVTTIGMDAFRYCKSLTYVTIGNSVTTIGHRAFANCDSLTSVTIPDSVTTIGSYAFYLCDSLETVCYNGTPTQWGNISIDSGNNDLTNADIHYNENKDHKCDTCGRVLSQCMDKDKDEICDICGKSLAVPAPAKPHKIANVVSGVHVYWKAVPGITKYGLWRSETGKNGTYKWVANPTVPHFTDTKVESGKTYYYKVTSMNAAGKHSEKSEAIGITYVSTPDITSRFNKAAGITVGWNKITGATGYAIYRKSYSGNDAWVRVGTIEGNSTLTWTDSSVKNNNGTAYKYTVRALAGSDMKTLSGCRNTGRTMARLTSRTISSAVKNGANAIKVSWNPTAAASGYEVRFMVGNTVYKTFTVGNYKTGVKTFTGIPNGATYKIQVRSYLKVDGMGFYSAWSEAKNVKLP